MKSAFPEHFNPSKDEFKKIWENCIFAVDANVLLNLYRYSEKTGAELQRVLSSLKTRLYLPHQAAKEFFRNRLLVTAKQLVEYDKVITMASELAKLLEVTTKHPFLPETANEKFLIATNELQTNLRAQKAILTKRLTDDEILHFVEQLFAGQTGRSFDEKATAEIIKEGQARYAAQTPPGFQDEKKESVDDPTRKYGDLLVWKQVLAEGVSKGKPVIFITDDKKDDWWLREAGHTIGPRPELRREFLLETKNEFWMYSVHQFVERVAEFKNEQVNDAALREFVEVRNERPRYEKVLHPVLTEDEVFEEIIDFQEIHPTADGSIGLKYFVVNFLGNRNFEINHSYACLNALNESGKIEIFRVEKNGFFTTRFRIVDTAN